MKCFWCRKTIRLKDTNCYSPYTTRNGRAMVKRWCVRCDRDHSEEIHRKVNALDHYLDGYDEWQEILRRRYTHPKVR